MRIKQLKNAPFVFLEGQSGLVEDEKELYIDCVKAGYECYIFDNLYEEPEKLLCLNYLKPKTIIFGTTGIYKDFLENLFKIAKELDFSNLENLILTLNTENSIRYLLDPFLEKYPKVKIYDIDGFLK